MPKLGFLEPSWAIIPFSMYKGSGKNPTYLRKEKEDKKEEVKLEENTQITKTQDFVINKDDKFKLSASSISDFLSCPQKFYYRNLIGLKEEIIYIFSIAAWLLLCILN